MAETGFGLGSFILRTAIKTLAVFLVIFSLAATLVGCLFPKTYMNMYRSLGLYGKAAAYASAAIDRALPSHGENCDGTCEYSRLLTDGIGIASISASADRINKEKWTLLSDFTGGYLSVGCHEARSAKTDASYLKAYGARDLATISILYGYDDYVWGEYIGSLRVADGDKVAALIDKAVAADVSVNNAEILNMLLEYLAYSSRFFGDGDIIKSVFETQCPHFFSAGKYTDLLNVYFGYAELAESLPSATLAQSALKSSLLYRLMKLSVLMDEIEENYKSSIENGEKNDTLWELVCKDLFGEAETNRITDLYTGVLKGEKKAA